MMDRNTGKGYVHVVDDEEHIRSSLAALLESEGYAVPTYESAERFLEQWRGDEGAACLLVDLRLPGMSGLELQRRLKELDPHHPPLIMITGQGDVPSAVHALKAGALDFLEKPLDNDEVLWRVAACVSEGERRVRLARFEALIARLTAREREVLDLLVEGHPNKAIGQVLGISPRTVEAHRAKIMEKLEAHSFSEMVRMSFELKRNPPAPR